VLIQSFHLSHKSIPQLLVVGTLEGYPMKETDVHRTCTASKNFIMHTQIRALMVAKNSPCKLNLEPLGIQKQVICSPNMHILLLGRGGVV